MLFECSLDNAVSYLQILFFIFFHFKRRLVIYVLNLPLINLCAYYLLVDKFM